MKNELKSKSSVSMTQFYWAVQGLVESNNPEYELEYNDVQRAYDGGKTVGECTKEIILRNGLMS